MKYDLYWPNLYTLFLNIYKEDEILLSLQDLRTGNQAFSHRTSFSSSASDSYHLRQRAEQPAYSFVGMHCIFDQCKSASNFIIHKYGL